MPAPPTGANRITLSRLQLPPRPAGASHSTIGGPPAIWTFFSLPPAKKPMNRLSGDQNGIGPALRARNWPRSQARLDGARSGPRIGRRDEPMFRPSGDTAALGGQCIQPDEDLQTMCSPAARS